MVEKTIINIIRRYLHALPAYGIHARQAVLFGSCVRGQTQAWSDIDLVVIAPEFDGRPTVQQVKQLWIATGVHFPRTGRNPFASTEPFVIVPSRR